jgi:PAS domain S-box-containing protein
MMTIFAKDRTPAGPRTPGFLTRLSNLIVIQGLFVFAALGIILFWPSGERISSADRAAVQSFVAKLGDRMLDACTPDSSAASPASRPVRLDENQLGAVHSAGLFSWGPDSSIVCFTHVASDLRQIVYGPGNRILSEADFELVRAAMERHPGFMLSSIYSTTSSIYYYRMDDYHGQPIVFAGIIEHRLFVSALPDLRHALFVLFLASTLLSLLTVHLIERRFKKPLKRLQRGLDKTAEGDRYHMIELDGDEELRSMSQSFNRMSETLWDNSRKLQSYNDRLSRISVSLLEAQQFLATLIDSSPDGVVVTSADGEVAIFNRQAAALFGWTCDEVIGRDIATLFAQQKAAKSAENRADTPDRSFETICRRKDSQQFPAFVVQRALRDDERQVRAHIYMVRDISESRSFQEMMIRLDRYYTRGEMAGDIAHEINNYLSILSGNLELLPIILKKNDPEKLEKKLDLMRGTVEKIARFSDGLMDKGHEELCVESTDLNQTVENVIAFLKPQNKFDAITLVTGLSSDIPSVQMDVGQMQQVLVNLVNNAADALANQEGEKRIEVVTSPCHNDPDRVSIVIADNGPGVSPEKVELLFARRFTTKRKGHGIGLITCQRIAAAHNGSIRYSFQDGARFEIELPIRYVAATAPVSEAAATVPAP